MRQLGHPHRGQRARAAHRAAARGARGARAHVPPALLALGRVVHARRHPRHRDPVLSGAPAARASSSSRRCWKSRAAIPSGACASSATRPVTPSTTPSRCAAGASGARSSAARRGSIPSSTRRKPYSKSFVLHLDAWYAQSHPDEDFAETFAVWLTPSSHWEKRYNEWPALEEARVHGRADADRWPGATPPVTTGEDARPAAPAPQDAAAALRSKRAALRPRLPGLLRSRSAAPVLRRARVRRQHGGVAVHRADPRDGAPASCRRGRAIYQYTIDQVLEEMIERCRELKLRLAVPEDEARHRVHGPAHRAGHELPAQRRPPGGAVKPQRVLALVHKHLVPPADGRASTSVDAPSGRRSTTSSTTLRELGHEVRALGVARRPRRRSARAIERVEAAHRLQPARGVRRRDDLRPERGRLPRAARGAVHRLQPARPACWRATRRSRRRCSPITASRCPTSRCSARAHGVELPQRLAFPLIVKSLTYEASIGISQASVVDDDEKLRERVAFIHESIGTDAIVEQYIEGASSTSA